MKNLKMGDICSVYVSYANMGGGSSKKLKKVKIEEWIFVENDPHGGFRGTIIEGEDKEDSVMCDSSDIKYYYKFYIGECPVCGKDKSYKERVYNQDFKKHVYLSNQETYCGCINCG